MPFISRKKYCAEGKKVGFNAEVCSLQKIAVQFTLSIALKGQKYFFTIQLGIYGKKKLL
jgi:hypothetical protein